MPFISVSDVQIYYEISGKGPRLLYISGTGADLRNKPNIFNSPLADHFKILAFDQRGLGQTDRPDISYSMEDYANDAAGLLKALGWDCCHVMGISFGGMVAQELALRHANCIDRLVLSCTSSGGAGGHLSATGFSVAATALTVTVGAGGAAGTSTGVAGGNSVFSSITATGGGFGKQSDEGGNGGSGGGGGSSDSVYDDSTGIDGQGNDGGSNSTSASGYPSGGGGG